MFAVIEDGSRQHRVEEGDLLSVDFRDGAEVGSSLNFERVLIANGGGASVIGTPVIEGATVAAEVVLDEDKGPKLEVQKFRRRKNSRTHTGHRQKYTRVRITSISVPNLPIVEEKAAAPEAETAPETAAE
ncbi:MAG: 50S ribosomal protein L21 [Fuerstiella sp.]